MLGAKAPPGVESVNFAWGGVLKFNLCAGLAEGGANLGSSRGNFKNLLFLRNLNFAVQVFILVNHSLFNLGL